MYTVVSGLKPTVDFERPSSEIPSGWYIRDTIAFKQGNCVAFHWTAHANVMFCLYDTSGPEVLTIKPTQRLPLVGTYRPMRDTDTITINPR